MKVWESSKFSPKKNLNSSQGINTSVFLSYIYFFLYYIQEILIPSLEKEFTKDIWLSPLVLAISKWSLHY